MNRRKGFISFHFSDLETQDSEDKKRLISE